MAIAASEVVVGLGLIVAMGRRNIELDVDKLRTLRGMNAAAWICLLLPLAAATAITLAGTASRAASAGYLSTATTLGAFAGRARRLRRSCSARRPRSAPTRLDGVDVALGRAVPTSASRSSPTSCR